MNDSRMLIAIAATAVALAACSTTSNSWRNNYDSSRSPDTPAWVLPMPGTYAPPAAPVPATPDKLEGSQMPATGGPTK